MRPVFAATILALVLGSALLVGCQSASPQSAPAGTPTADGNAPPQGYGGPGPSGPYGGGQRGNLTDAQRAAMAQRMQAAIDACSGLAVGDNCTAPGFNGTAQAGTCQQSMNPQNASLMCRGMSQGFGGRGNRTVNRSGYGAPQYPQQ